MISGSRNSTTDDQRHPPRCPGRDSAWFNGVLAGLALGFVVCLLLMALFARI